MRTLVLVAAGVLAWSGSASAATVVRVTAGKPSEFRFTLSTKSVPHGAVVFVISNKGSLPHDFKIAGKASKLIGPGTTARLTVVFGRTGKFAYLCTVTGHADAGMKGILTVR